MTGAPGFEDLGERAVESLDCDVAIFFLDKDELESAFRQLGGEVAGAGHKVLYATRDLEHRPGAWAGELGHFDEVWLASDRSAPFLRAAGKPPVVVLPLPCHPVLSQLRSRRHFGISETAYVLVAAFDMKSESARKNLFALVDAAQRVCQARPYDDFQVVFGVAHADADPSSLTRLRQALVPLHGRALVIDRLTGDDDLTNLVRVGDAFVSLHHAGGVGSGHGEAMYFGKPVVVTGRPGSLDCVTPQTALLEDPRSLRVEPGPSSLVEGQVWGEPDPERAAALMIRLIDDPDWGRAIGVRASAHVRTHFSRRACGLRYLGRLEAVGLARPSERSLADPGAPTRPATPR